MRLHNITNPNGNWIQIWTAGGLRHNLHESLNCASVCVSEESSGLFAITVQLPLEINFLKQKQDRSIVNTYQHHCSRNEKASSSPVQKYWRLGKFKRNIYGLNIKEMTQVYMNSSKISLSFFCILKL